MCRSVRKFEEKYTIKENIIITLIENKGENINVKRALEVLEQKYSKTKTEKVLELMKNISEFRTAKKVEVLINRLEDRVTMVRRVNW